MAVLKNKKRLYATKVLSSSSDEEIDSHVKNKKIDNYPKVPQILKNSKSRRILQNKKNYSSEQENETQYVQLREKENYNFTPGIPQINGKLF